MRALDLEVVDAVWATVAHHIPPHVDNHPKGGHRPRIDDRTCFQVMLVRLVTGCSWVDAERLCRNVVSDTTVRARYHEWIDADLFDTVAAHALAAFDRIVGLDREVPLLDGRRVPYVNLDNAASTPALVDVARAVDEFMPFYSSVHRGTGFKSRLSTVAYDQAHAIIGRFVGADPRTNTVIFGKNTTEAINKLAWRYPLGPDAVVITTPTFTHTSLAVMAANAGKHILLEKPMALNLEECDTIIAAAEANGVRLQLGFMRRFDPEFVAAAERIEAGEIGRPMLIKSLTHGPGLPPAWARDLKTSNGMLAEVNSHDLDAVRWLMASNPRRMYVEVANFKGAERGVTSEHFYDNMFATVKFESGALGNISGVCPCDYGYDSRVEIIGKKGRTINALRTIIRSSANTGTKKVIMELV